MKLPVTPNWKPLKLFGPKKVALIPPVRPGANCIPLTWYFTSLKVAFNLSNVDSPLPPLAAWLCFVPKPFLPVAEADDSGRIGVLPDASELLLFVSLVFSSFLVSSG